MAMKKKGRLDAEIDVTSFSDIAFLLIIFFILTTSIVRMTGQELNIPSGQTSTEKTEEKTMTVNLTPNQIRFGDDEKAPILTMEELRAKLFEAELRKKTNDKDRMVILNSGSDVPYEMYFKVVCAITEAGGILALVEEDLSGKEEGGE